VATIGDGVSSAFTNAFLMQNTQHLPEELRDRRAGSEGPLRLAAIGPNEQYGGGRAYTEKRGFAGEEPVNLSPPQMEFTRASPFPIDAEMLKQTLDIEQRRIAGRRPFRFDGSHVEEDNGLTYTLSADLRPPHSIQEYIRRQAPSGESAKDLQAAAPRTFSRQMKDAARSILGRTPDAAADSAPAEGAGRSQGMMRRVFGNYVADTVRAVLNETPDVSLDNIAGHVTNVRYDLQRDLFHLRVQPQGAPAFMVRARNIVLAPGHQADTLPEAFKDLKDSPDVFLGEDVYRFQEDVPQRAGDLRKKRGLIVGTGLQMNDVAIKLQDHGIESFSAVSRHGNTHELPQEVPRQPELESVAYEIYDLLNSTSLRSGGLAWLNRPGGAEKYTEQVRRNFERARAIAENYEPESDEPLVIRGQSFDRARVHRALLSQYVAYRYESLRDASLRTEVGDEQADKIVRMGLESIDFHPDHASWLTTSRTSTTDRNILANVSMRDRGQLLSDEIQSVERHQGRYRVKFASGKQDIVDYFLMCSGRKPPLGDPDQLAATPLIADLQDQGLIRLHPIGLGVDMAMDGRAIPDPARFPRGRRQPGVYVVAPSLAKGELLAPRSRDRAPLNNVVAESVMGMRPLAQQIADSLTLKIFGRRPTPEHQLQYIYHPSHVEVREPQSWTRSGNPLIQADLLQRPV